MTMPPDGMLVADLETLRAYVGARTTTDDELLADRLTAATAWVYNAVYETDWMNAEVQEAILQIASRLYKRRQSPEGVAGMGGEGAVVHIVARDPDVQSLLELHLNYTNAGIA
jgi:hypothetical protein